MIRGESICLSFDTTAFLISKQINILRAPIKKPTKVHGSYTRAPRQEQKEYKKKEGQKPLHIKSSPSTRSTIDIFASFKPSQPTPKVSKRRRILTLYPNFPHPQTTFYFSPSRQSKQCIKGQPSS